MKQPRAGYAPFFLAIGVIVTACATGTSASPTTTTDAPSRETRSDCTQILGTPFRSDEERTWFEQNCSKWPLVDSPNAAAAVQQPPECASMRGKPYTSTDQRQWYLANCSGATKTQDNSTARSSSGSQFTTPGTLQANPLSQFSNSGSDQPPTTSGGDADRTDCGAIQGTAYRSAGERAWFMTNCTGNTQDSNTRQAAEQPSTNERPAAQGSNDTSNSSRSSRQSSGLPQASTGDRTDCYAIGGTPYRSANEQAWFLANCFPPRSSQNGNSDSNNGNDRGNRDRDNDDD